MYEWYYQRISKDKDFSQNTFSAINTFSLLLYNIITFRIACSYILAFFNFLSFCVLNFTNSSSFQLNLFSLVSAFVLDMSTTIAMKETDNLMFQQIFRTNPSSLYQQKLKLANQLFYQRSFLSRISPSLYLTGHVLNSAVTPCTDQPGHEFPMKLHPSGKLFIIPNDYLETNGSFVFLPRKIGEKIFLSLNESQLVSDSCEQNLRNFRFDFFTNTVNNLNQSSVQPNLNQLSVQPEIVQNKNILDIGIPLQGKPLLDPLRPEINVSITSSPCQRARRFVGC